MIVLRLSAFLVGAGLVFVTFMSATRTFVLPRSSPVVLTNLIFKWVRKFFNSIVKIMPTYEQRDSIMALYAPLCLLLMVPTWLLLTALGYMLMYWALGISTLWEAFLFSGSSILTLGFATSELQLATLLAFTEATVGLILVAMLISYLPTMYTEFSQRETAVSLLQIRAGSPPTVAELMWRLQSISKTGAFETLWQDWEHWFTRLDESHTSLPALVFFRSPQSQHSWLNSSAVVLDAAAFYLSATNINDSPSATLVIRAGNDALRRIADYFKVPYNPDPHFPEDPIQIRRADFDKACDRLARQGIPIKEDRDLAWRNFAGWRVNYDSVVVGLAELTMAPESPWLSEYTFVPANSDSGETGGSLQKADD